MIMIKMRIENGFSVLSSDGGDPTTHAADVVSPNYAKVGGMGGGGETIGSDFPSKR